MDIKPQEAHDIYNKAERKACDEYADYWISKFAKVGVVFTKEIYYGSFSAEHNGYKIIAWVRPAQFNGVRFKINYPGRIASHYMKIKSDSGFDRLMNYLTVDIAG